MKKTKLFLFSSSILLLISCNSDLKEIQLNSVPFKDIKTVTSETVTLSRAGSSAAPRGSTVQPYEIGCYEVTYELWYSVYEWAVHNGYVFENAGLPGASDCEPGILPELAGEDVINYPVTKINWWDAVLWCNAYSEETGRSPVFYQDAAYTKVLRQKEEGMARPYLYAATEGNTKIDACTANGFRLPSMLEWEFAARGGDCSAEDWYYNWSGSDDWEKVCVSDRECCEVPGTLSPNRLGLYDMSGNVWEWVFDEFSGYCNGGTRSLRGGCAISTSQYCKNCTWYSPTPDTYCEKWCGFRVVRSIL